MTKKDEYGCDSGIFWISVDELKESFDQVIYCETNSELIESKFYGSFPTQDSTEITGYMFEVTKDETYVDITLFNKINEKEYISMADMFLLVLIASSDKKSYSVFETSEWAYRHQVMLKKTCKKEAI